MGAAELIVTRCEVESTLRYVYEQISLIMRNARLRDAGLGTSRASRGMVTVVVQRHMARTDGEVGAFAYLRSRIIHAPNSLITTIIDR